MKRWTLFALMAVICLSLAKQAHAQPQIGEKMPEFNLQATDGKFYGIKDTDDKISILFFLGHT